MCCFPFLVIVGSGCAVGVLESKPLNSYIVTSVGLLDTVRARLDGPPIEVLAFLARGTVPQSIEIQWFCRCLLRLLGRQDLGALTNQSGFRDVETRTQVAGIMQLLCT